MQRQLDEIGWWQIEAFGYLNEAAPYNPVTHITRKTDRRALTCEDKDDVGTSLCNP